MPDSWHRGGMVDGERLRALLDALRAERDAQPHGSAAWREVQRHLDVLTPYTPIDGTSPSESNPGASEGPLRGMVGD